MDAREILQQGLRRQNLSLDEQQCDQLIQFVGQLKKWNSVYNLTAVRDELNMVSRHLLDSLTVAPFVQAFSAIADLGSGGGLPGIPLAIAFPQKKFSLLDSNSKKTRFLVHAAATLGLRNVSVVHQRIEDFSPENKFDCLVARAFAAPQKIMQMAGHLCSEEASLVLMVGHLDGLDLSNGNGFYWHSTTRVDVYNEPSIRHVVVFARRGQR
ncbi:MAG: 16S rRNA (guanine(527)-N(7))-methyltransferase RsmG [Gammaproteobacteria bacterium]|nr:16S rRNA (guanine(527)-N(7))-methyltransferase RsmG [Gammaproteobacteria bacterium]